MEPTRIQFTGIEGMDLGYVDYVRGQLTASNEGQQFAIDIWLEMGRSPEMFVEKFSDWSNGYSKSFVVKNALKGK